MSDLHISVRKSEHQKDLGSYRFHSTIEYYGFENWLKIKHEKYALTFDSQNFILCSKFLELCDAYVKKTTFNSSSKWWKKLRERDKDIEWKWAIEMEWKIEKKKINRCQAMQPTTECEAKKKYISITEKYMLTVK